MTYLLVLLPDGFQRATRVGEEAGRVILFGTSRGVQRESAG